MSNNNQKIDYLKEDEEIYNQRFCCLSFIEPRDSKIMTQKEMFMASRFMKAFIEEYDTAKEFASNPNNTITDEIKKKMDLSFDNIFDTYKGYRKTHFANLTTDFDKKYNPKEAVTVSGVKVRGSFRSLEEAQERAKKMREYEPAVNCFVAQVGYWLPYDPENMEDVKAEFREEQLNEIYGKREEELAKAKVEFDKRKQVLMEKNKQEQEEKKKLAASETMKTLTDGQSHQDKKQVLEVIDEEPKKEEKKKEEVKKVKKQRSKKSVNKRKINRKNKPEKINKNKKK